MGSRILEQGDVYFAYRPRVGHEEVGDESDIQRLFLLLQPSPGGATRRIVIGRKRMPQPGEHERYWGFVDEVSARPAELADDLSERRYQTETRGERTLPAARPVGEGRYALVEHDDHTHLAYELELPEEPGEAQQDLQVLPEASYILAVRNPQAPTPPGAGLAPEQRADLPVELQRRFDNRRFTSAAPDLLDRQGVELVLIGAAEDAEQELGIHLDTESETAESAEVFRRLRLSRDVPTGPLTEGEWE